MGLEIDRRLELKGIDTEIFRSSERRYTRASLLALSETEVCKQLTPVGFDAVVLGLSRLEVEETVDSWEQLADSPVSSSNRTDSDSLSESVERPYSSSGILLPVNTSDRTESHLLLGPIERPNSRQGILPPVNTSGGTESDSLLGLYELPNSRQGILPPVNTSGRTLLGPIERPKSKRGIPPPASFCGNGLLPPPCTLRIPPGCCGLLENPSSCSNWESKPQINCNTDAPQLKAGVLDQSLETGFSLLSKSANPYRPPHCREAQAQLDTKVDSDVVCSPKLQISEMEIQSVNLEAREYSNLMSSSGQTDTDDCLKRIDCERPCERPFVDASTPSSSKYNQTAIVFGDLEEFICLTELHDIKANELDFEDVWSEVSAKMRFEQEMELKRGAEHDDETSPASEPSQGNSCVTVAGSEDEKCLPEDNCDDHNSADSDATICLPDEDSLISIDDMLRLDISSLKDDKENNSVKEDTPEPKPKPKQEGARRGILEDIARSKRRSGPVLPLPLLLPHQILHRYHCPSSGATALIPPSPPLSGSATAPIPPPPLPSSGVATSLIPPLPSSGVATSLIPPLPSSGVATALIPPPPLPLSHGTGTFFMPPPIPWGYHPAIMSPVFTHFYQA